MKPLLKKYGHKWLQVIQNVSWAQWNRLGLMGTGGSNQYSIDIEASLLLAAPVMAWDGRLWEGIYSWLERYETIVNGERLANLIRRGDEGTLAPVLGGLIKAGPFKTLTSVLKTCRKLSAKNWGPPVQKPARSKLDDHQNILKNNAGIRYRYLYGTSLRADILYLLSVSHRCKKKRDMDYLTTVRLADVHLGCDRSTVYRLQKDLEEGDILVPQRELKNQYIVTWTVKDDSVFFKQKTPETGLIRWTRMNDLFFDLFQLMEDLKKISDETVAKYRIANFLGEYVADLADHGIQVPKPYSRALGPPLKEDSLKDLAKTTTQALQSFYDLIVKST
ncbi:MAG: hypothetical protein HY466_03795 [Deltaproteobacteria bacterium]|nr:hypothetical protein [Deltaproteobacteria bacterium]